jgi:hypothetical protein
VGSPVAKRVTEAFSAHGSKRLVDISVAGGAPITATAQHPFWVPKLNTWVDAKHLQPGQWLRTAAGTLVQTTGVRHRNRPATVHNISVAGTETYFVGGGRSGDRSSAVLVHNATPCWDIDEDTLDEIYVEFGHDILDGIEHNAREYAKGKLNHALAHIGRDPKKLAEYLRDAKKFRTFDRYDTKNPNTEVSYDEANEVLIIKNKNGRNIHAYNKPKDEWLKDLAKGRYVDN